MKYLFDVEFCVYTQLHVLLFDLTTTRVDNVVLLFVYIYIYISICISIFDPYKRGDGNLTIKDFIAFVMIKEICQRELFDRISSTQMY